MRREHVTEASVEHMQWIQGLEFYLEEVGRLEGLLQEISSQSKASGSAADIEHFQNQLIIQRNNIQELLHSIRGHMSRFGHAMVQAEGKPSKMIDESHATLRESYSSFEKVMNELRLSMKSFLSGVD